MRDTAAAVKATDQVRSGHPACTWLGFLSPEEVVAWRDRAELARILADGFDGDDEAAFTAANRLALEAFRGGEPGTAKLLCATEIAYATARLRAAANPRLVMLGLQPVVNLIRLDGYVLDLEAARRGLAQLELIAEGEPVEVHGFALGAGLIAELGGAWPRIRRFAQANCLIETAKVLWRRGLVDEMLAGCDRLARKWPEVAATGPFHAFEARWLVEAEPLSAETARWAPEMLRIARLHALAQTCAPRAGAATPADPHGLADGLFSSRITAAAAASPQASARWLALLGDAMMHLGDDTRGSICFTEAHSHARSTDPALANLIRTRWLKHAAEEAVPAVVTSERLEPADIARLSELALVRLRA